MKPVSWMILCLMLLAAPAAAAVGAEEAKSGPAQLTVADGVAALKQGRYAVAFEILQPFAEQGDSAAQVNLGILLQNGLGAPVDAEAARSWFEAAAAQGLASAFGRLGALHQGGKATPRDIATALRWYRGGAALGDSASLFGLGLLYQNGDGVPANSRTAATYYRMAAELGHGRAQFMLGVMYLQGRGVPKDPLEAYRWFLTAEPSIPAGYMREQIGRATRLLQSQLTSAEAEAARERAQDRAAGK
jgi:TPR repeat protein